MDQKLREIIEQSSQLFIRLGIKSMTMDDIARNLRMSKKTLYQYVKDKSDLVFRCIEASCQSDQAVVTAIRAENKNAIDELLAISEFVSARLKYIHPSIFFDLEKYHPDAMSCFDKHKEDFIAECIRANLLKGIAEGLYRTDLNPGIVTGIYLSLMDHLLHGWWNKQEDTALSEAYAELIRYHLRGIASSKGLQYIESLPPTIKHEI